MTHARPMPLEIMLRSPWWRSVAVLALVVAFSLAMSVPRAEIASLRGHPVDRTELFIGELVRWGAWALAAWPMGVLARWILARTGSWILFLLLQVPLAAGGAYAFLHLDSVLYSTGRSDLSDPLSPGLRGPQTRPRRGARDDGLGPGRRRAEEDFEGRRGAEARRPGMRPEGRVPTLDSPYWQFRWMQSFVVYWVVLMMGAAVRSFLELREKERRTADLELRSERLRAQLASAQIDSLRSQLNPHFLFNSLHTVGGLVRSGQEQVALKTLAAIGELLRATLEHGEAEEVRLAEEVQIAERYLDIERIRLGERLQLELEIEEGIGSALVPALLLLPLVENAVRHGISSLPEGGRVHLRARRAGPSLELEVTDDGVGFPVELLEAGELEDGQDRRHIGLENSRSRLLALYGKAQQFELLPVEPRGARVRVVLPYHEQELPKERS